MKSNIEIHFVFADGIVKRCTSVREAYEFLMGHYAFIGSDEPLGKDDYILTVLSSGLSAEDETFINRQVSFNKEAQLGVSDDKIIN